MRATFLELLRAELGADFTDEVEDAWRAAFKVLARSILDGPADQGLPTATDRFFTRLSHGRNADHPVSGGAEAPQLLN
jgi:hypothetical protein